MENGTIYKSSKIGLYVGQYTINYKRHSVYQKKNEKIGDFKKRFNNILSSINTGTYIEKSCSNFINKKIQKITIDDIEDCKESPREYS